MANQDLKKMTRSELLELLLTQTREVERLREELARKETILENRHITLEEAGNIAQAALEINGVFTAAQAAADQYLKNIAEMESQTREKCLRMEQETQEKCREMIRGAEREANAFWEDVREKIKDPFRDHLWWTNMMKEVNGRIQTEE